MAKWTAPVRQQHERVEAYLVARFGDVEHNIALDTDRRIVLLEIPSLNDADMAALIVELQAKYPQAF